MEPLIVIVGFLGAGKTTLLKKLAQTYLENAWDLRIILNDYENARLDSLQFSDFLDSEQIEALNGSCICCSGINELRTLVNEIPERPHGITLIEANGTSDACTLMEFLGVGIKDQFSPPIQISVVDVRSWQKRGVPNELEANQVQVSSLIVLNHSASVTEDRLDEVKQSLQNLNPRAQLVLFENLEELPLLALDVPTGTYAKMDHLKAHWSSCSIDLPEPISEQVMLAFMRSMPKGILRAKGCTRLEGDEHYTFFERIPSGEVSSRKFHGNLVAGPQLVTVGPDSDPKALVKSLEASLV